MQAAFRRMVFNILACNCDDHTRQHSYLMDARGEWRLAPAYDLTHSAGPGGEHYLDVAGERRTPTIEHVRSLGRKHALPPRAVETLIDEVRTAVGGWEQFSRDAGVSRNSHLEIGSSLKTVAQSFFV